jgi:flagella basal body P-ring formation protein FlgA
MRPYPKSISLACLTVLWGLATTPQSQAACANAQKAIRVHWDPVLRQSWVTTFNCDHPERPAQAARVVSQVQGLFDTKGRVDEIAVRTSPIVHAGETVLLWSEERNTRIEVSGTAEENGAIGDTIHVRLTQNTSVAIVPQLVGVVRGAGNVEMLP